MGCALSTQIPHHHELVWHSDCNLSHQANGVYSVAGYLGLPSVRLPSSTSKKPHRAADNSRGMSPLPYGGSDRSVFLRSLPLSHLNSLLLVICTMAFFILLVGGYGGRSISVGELPVSTPSVTHSSSGSNVFASLKWGSARLYASRSSRRSIAAINWWLQSPMEVGHIGGTASDAARSREPIDLVAAGEIEISTCRVVLPAINAWHAVRLPMISAPESQANFPQLC